MQPITPGSVVFPWNGKSSSVAPSGGAAGYAGLVAPAVILLPDSHGDHLASQTLASLSVSKALLVGLPVVAEQRPKIYW